MLLQWLDPENSGYLVFLGLVLLAAAGLGLRRHNRSFGHLRRKVMALAEAHRQALQQAGHPSELSNIAVGVLMQWFARQEMTRAEAVVVAGRCRNLDELTAQVILRERGMSAYGAYLKRFAATIEVADAAQAASGDRFPGMEKTK